MAKLRRPATSQPRGSAPLPFNATARAVRPCRSLPAAERPNHRTVPDSDVPDSTWCLILQLYDATGQLFDLCGEQFDRLFRWNFTLGSTFAKISRIPGDLRRGPWYCHRAKRAAKRGQCFFRAKWGQCFFERCFQTAKRGQSFFERCFPNGGSAFPNECFRQIWSGFRRTDGRAGVSECPDRPEMNDASRRRCLGGRRRRAGSRLELEKHAVSLVTRSAGRAAL